MYHQSIPRELGPSTLKSSTGDVPLTQSAKAIMYYTKQDSQSGQNAFDLNDEDEHKFMHTGDPEERFIDHGEDLKRIRMLVTPASGCWSDKLTIYCMFLLAEVYIVILKRIKHSPEE